MDFVRKNKFAFWTIVLLVILNLLTLGTLWFQKGKAERFPRRVPGGPDGLRYVGRFMERELDLSKEQARQFRELRRRHFQKTREIREKVRVLKKEILKEAFKPTPDAEKAARMIEAVGAGYAEMERFLFEHFKDLKSVCREEQSEKLQRLFFEMSGPTRPPRSTRRMRPNKKIK